MTTYIRQKNPFLDRRPYVYFIMWTKHNLAYIGVRHAKNCHPDDLWTRYFTSSKYVQEQRELLGEPDHLEILEIFLTADEAVNYEQDVIRTFELHANPIFLNRNCAGSFVMDIFTKQKIREAMTGKIHSEETKSKISSSKTGIKHSADSRVKMSQSRMGKVMSKETRARISESRTGHKVSNETRSKLSDALKGRHFSDEHRAKISKSNKGKVSRTRKPNG